MIPTLVHAAARLELFNNPVSMALPLRAFREKYGDLPGDRMSAKLQEFAHEFLQHEPAGKLEMKSQKVEVKG